MALNVQINGVEQREYVQYRSMRIQKDHAVETCRVEFRDMDSTASAFRPEVGDEIRVDRDGVSLEFGGEIVRVEDRRIGASDIGTVTIVEARGWYFEASEVFIPLLVVPAQDLFVTAYALFERYLSPKGWTSLIGATGGPALPALVYENLTLAAVFDDLTKRSGYPWRVNGDREYAFVEIGSLVAPVTYTDSNAIVLRGATWSQDRVRSASRLLITTGGTGQFLPHAETYAANSQTSFPLHVLPPSYHGRVNNPGGYAVGASSVAFTGLPTSATVRLGSTIRFATHLGYTATAAATTDGDGSAIVGITPTLTNSLTDGEVGVFGPEAFVSLEVGGTPTALDGAPWSYDAEQARVYTNSAAPSSPVTARYRIDLPARVRVWTDAAQNADGTFDYGAITDAQVTWPELSDVAQVQTDGETELTYLRTEPKILKLATYAQEVYPWMLAECSFPDRLISGQWLIQGVTLTDVGRLDQQPRVELTLVEGTSIGRDWRDFWRGRDRGAAVQPVAYVSQSVIEVMVFTQNAEVSQSVIEVMAQPDADAYVSQSVIEVMVA